MSRYASSGARTPTFAGAGDRSDDLKTQHEQLASSPHEECALTWLPLAQTAALGSACSGLAAKQRKHDELLRTDAVSVDQSFSKSRLRAVTKSKSRSAPAFSAARATVHDGLDLCTRRLRRIPTVVHDRVATSYFCPGRPVRTEGSRTRLWNEQGRCATNSPLVNQKTKK